MLKKTKLASLLMTAFTAVVLLGQEINIIGPSTPVARDVWEMLIVSGLEDIDPATVQLEIIPSDGVRAVPTTLWGGQHAIWFRASKPGKYSISIGVNKWRQSLDTAFVDAKKAKLSAAELSEIEALITKFSPKYPLRTGTASLEVAGSVPPSPSDPLDPNEPNQPVDPNQRVNRLTYVYEKDNGQVPRPVSFALQRLNVDSVGSVVATEFEKDTVDGTGEVPDQYKIALESARKAGLPALVVQAGATVVRVVKAPTTVTEVMEAAK